MGRRRRRKRVGRKEEKVDDKRRDRLSLWVCYRKKADGDGNEEKLVGTGNWNNPDSYRILAKHAERIVSVAIGGGDKYRQQREESQEREETQEEKEHKKEKEEKERREDIGCIKKALRKSVLLEGLEFHTVSFLSNEEFWFCVLQVLSALSFSSFFSSLRRQTPSSSLSSSSPSRSPSWGVELNIVDLHTDFPLSFVSPSSASAFTNVSVFTTCGPRSRSFLTATSFPVLEELLRKNKTLQKYDGPPLLLPNVKTYTAKVRENRSWTLRKEERFLEDLLRGNTCMESLELYEANGGETIDEEDEEENAIPRGWWMLNLYTCYLKKIELSFCSCSGDFLLDGIVAVLENRGLFCLEELAVIESMGEERRTTPKRQTEGGKERQTKTAVERLAKLLQKNKLPRLSTLTLHGNYLKKAEIRALTKTVRFNRSLKTLYVDNEDECTCDFEKALVYNFSLTFLCTCNQQTKSRQTEELLERNKTDFDHWVFVLGVCFQSAPSSLFVSASSSFRFSTSSQSAFCLPPYVVLEIFYTLVFLNFPLAPLSLQDVRRAFSSGETRIVRILRMAASLY